ncbi:extracellular solute-binding protein [Paenibacillus tianmuensis]|uniref:Extracellular solute-binding protein n=1 Tax=Paenibacillus tianmuensis TaxID=624147 RepID=A0A1G4TNM6_9BACL|nr:extracellular solute-binding protein [Paenibacillus tianmuensis]
MATALVVTGLLAGCGTAKQEGAAASGSPKGAEPAVSGKPAEINVYTAMEEEQIKTYLSTFKSQYPNIKVNIVRDSTGTMTAKLIAEKDNPQADVIWGLAATSLLVMDDQKMLEPYAPKGVDRVCRNLKIKRTLRNGSALTFGRRRSSLIRLRWRSASSLSRNPTKIW